MKRVFPSLASSLVLLLLSSGALTAAPLEFFATVKEKVPVDATSTDVVVELTPTFSLSVRVTPLTEIKDRDGLPITLDEINPGDLVAVEAIHTEAGLLALELQKQDAGTGFEIKGPLDSVDVAGGSIELLGLTVLVDDSTKLRDHLRQPLTLQGLADLLASSVGPLWVKVEATVVDGDILAQSIHVLGSVVKFARISLEGVIVEFPSPDQFLMDLGGGIQVLVTLTPDTEVTGDLAVGVFVKVKGLISPNLGVTALTVKVIGLWEVVPRRLGMDLNDSRQVSILLRRPFETDLEFTVVSLDPGLVSVDPAAVTIPAGALNATFLVNSGGTAGETQVEVTAPSELGGGTQRVLVKVGDDDHEPKEPELEWAPRVVRAAPNGALVVRVMLKHGPTPVDLPVALTLEDASPDLVLSFPPEVVIPAGAVNAPVELLFGSRTGSGKLVAELPEEVGGDTAELDIDLRPAVQTRLRLEWRPASLRLPAGTSGAAVLRLSAPAPVDLEVAINLAEHHQNAGLVGFPATVQFPAGSTEAAVTFQAGSQAGRAQFIASLPPAWGGDSARLEVRVLK